MNDLVYVGYISGPFGLKGQLKVITDSNHLDKIFVVKNTLYIDNNPYQIKSYQFHKHHSITFEGYEDINQVDNLIKKDVYIKRCDLNLGINEYLLNDLLGCKIIDNNKEIGNVEDVLLSKHTYFIKSGELIIPMIDKYIERVDTKDKIIYVKGSKELIL